MAATAPQQIVVNVKDGKAVVPASMAGARIEIVDVDLVFILPDGTKIVLPGLGLQALSGNPPIVEFTDAKISAKDLIGQVGEVRSLKDAERVDLTSAQASSLQGKADPGAAEAPTPRPPAPPQSAQSADARMSAVQAEQAAQQAAADVKRAASKGAAQAEMATPIAPTVVAPPPGSSNSGVGSDSAEPKLPATSFAFSAAETTQGGAKIGSLFETGSTYLGKVAFTLAGKAADMFVIDQATGVISLAPGAKLDYETATTHLIQAIAQGGGIKPTAIEILVSVVDVNEAPAAPAFVWGGSVKENSATGVSVGQVAAADPEGAATVTYELLDDGGGRFAIDAKTGLVTVKDGAKLDFEKGVEHAIVVKATDLGGLTSSANLNVKVLDVNEAPTAPELVSGGTVAENSKGGTAVLSVRSSDQDAGDAITFSLVNDFGGRLTIDAATGAVTVAKGAVINFETDPKLNVVVRASDKAGLHSESAFVVKVTDVNEAPSDIKILSQVQLTEGAKAGASAAKIEAIDPDANDIVRYSIEKDESGRFAIDASTGEVTVVGDAKFDVSKQSQFPIVVRATDKAGLFSEKELTISVLATSNVPINPDALIFKAKENIPGGSMIGKIPTVGDSISEFAFKDSAEGRFTIDSKTGEIRLAGSSQLDYETAAAYNLEALLTTTTGPLILKIVVGVEDVNEAPSPPAFVFGGLVADSAANGVNVGIVKAADPDANDKIAYQLLDDAGGRFAIDSTTGVVSVLDGTRIDFESAKTYDIVVRATDRNGAADGLSASATLKIIVDDINERPVLEGIQPVTIKENLAPFTTIATAKATDADVGDSITYSMVNDAGGLFAIDAKTGVIRVAGGAEVNYESLGADGATLTLTVRATDVAGLHDERDVTVVVEDVAEAPRTVSFQQASPLPENSAAGVVVGKVVAIDDDAGSVLTYSLDSAGGAGFAIDEATGEIRVAEGAKLDFETGATISLKVFATDETNLSKTATVSIALADVNEAPTTLSLQGGRVMAGASDLGRLVGVDPDKGDELKYALTDNPGGLFQVDATTGLLTLAPGANPVLSAYRITATATDKSNLSITNSFDIAFRTTNTAPSAIELSMASAPRNYAANGSFENFAAAASASETDGVRYSDLSDLAGWTVTAGTASIVSGATRVSDGGYALSVAPAGGGAAAIVQSLSDLKAGASYKISYVGSADAKLIWNGAEAVVARVGDRYEASVSASATTATIGFSSAADFRIDDVKVTAIGALEMSVAEGASGGSVVGKVNVIDSDSGERFTYSLSDNADGRFGINSEGQIIVLDGSRIDFETAKVHSITARVLDSGGAEAVQTFAIAVSNVTGQVVGGTAADTLDGTSEEDFVLGLAGDDRLTGRAGADRLVGGAGIDTADYATSAAPVDVDLTRTGPQSGGFAQGDILAGIENVTGSIGDDILTGDAGVNVLRGAGGDDRLDGGGGADTLDGGGGDDIYIVGNSGVTIAEVDGGGSDEVRTTLGAYTLTNWVEQLTYTGPGAFRGVGNALDNILNGGAGADTLIGLAGADKLDGGGGVDTADYAESAAGVIVNLANGQASGGDAEGDTLVAIENVIGAASAANRLTGTAGVNVLTGGVLNDELDAGGAGGAGDTLRGGKGDDLYYVSNATDLVVENANEGVDSVRSRIATFTLADNVENLKYIGAAATLTLTGNARANRIEAGDGAGALYGLGGDDVLVGGSGADTLDGGDGVDTADYSGATVGVTIDLRLAGAQTAAGAAQGDVLIAVENLIGSATEANVLIGAAGVNRLEGGAKADRLDGGAGADVLIGGGGDDTYVVDDSKDVVAEFAGGGVDTVETGAASFALGDFIENLTLTRGGGATGTGNALANTITGGAGDDVLAGLGGADTLDGGGGTMNIADYRQSQAGVIVDLASSMQTGGDADGDALSNIQGVFGSLQSGNSLYGGAGANRLVGGDAADMIDGRGGADTMDGGKGDDIYYVDDLNDVIVEAVGGGFDKVYTTIADYAAPANVEEVIYIGVATPGANYAGYVDLYQDISTSFAGGAVPAWGADKATWGQNQYVNQGIGQRRWIQTGIRLTGDAAVNTLKGGAGDDLLIGGPGADKVDGQGGSDAVDYRSSAAGVTIDLTRTTAQASRGDANGDVITNVENAFGSTTSDNWLTGTSGANVLVGGFGRDILNGGAGADAMFGGDGNDVYVVDSTQDRILDTAGFDEVVTTLSTYTLTIGMEALRYSGAATFSGMGNGAANVIVGGAGADTLNGAAGTDVLVGDVDPLNLIRDGSFEETFTTTPGAYWTRTGSVNAMRVTSGGSDGGQQAWFYIGEPGGSIAQVVATRAGQTYTLRYDFIGGAAANQLRVEAVGLTKSDLNQVVGVFAGGTYQTRTLTFTASSEQTIIRFTDASPSPRPWHYLLDNVRLHEGLVVPPAPAGANDTLIGGADNDRLSGGGGDDLLRGGHGADWMDGGAGVDTADYSDSTGGETVNLNLATQISVNWASGDQLLRIENVTGSNFADSLIGDGGDNVLRGLSGADTLLGGAGADTLDGGVGADSMDGGAGNDTFIVDDVNDVVTESTNAGDDLVRTALATYTLSANVENLTYTGASAFVGKGNELDNIITGGAGADTLEGGDGADTLLGLGGADILRGGTGIDAVDYTASTLGVWVDLNRADAQVSTGDASGDVLSSIESVTGSAVANNVLIGDAAANVLIGGAGGDLLRGGAGADRLQGGGGFDMVDYGTSNAGVTVDLQRLTAQTSTGDASGDTLLAIEGVSGSRFSDVLTGDIASNLLEGDVNLVVNGGFAFGHSVRGAAPIGWMLDGTRAGAQRPNFGASLEDARAFAFGFGGPETGAVLSQTIATEAGKSYTLSYLLRADFGPGVLEANVLSGGAVLSSRTDTITGTTGWVRATMTFTAQSAQTTLSFTDRSAFNANDLTIDKVCLYADDGAADTLIGAGGNDVLYGGGGNDILRGGAGTDQLEGGAGIDTADYSDQTMRGVIVDLQLTGGASQRQSFSDAAGDMLYDIENVTGSDFSDWLIGDAGVNVLRGGKGGDVLAGLGGADVLDGGAGVDTVSYQASDAGVSVNLATGAVSGGHATGDTLIGIENAIGSNFNDTLVASSATVGLAGAGGDDRLTGNASGNVLLGGDGDDLLDGLAGNDRLYGGAGDDVIRSGAANTSIGASSAALQAYAASNPIPGLTIVYDAAANSFFAVVPTLISWEEANDIAAATLLNGVPGRLARIDSAADSAAVTAARAGVAGYTSFGASDLAEEGVWRWMEGDLPSDQFWQGASNGTAIGGAFTTWQAFDPNEGLNGNFGVTAGNWWDTGNQSTSAYVIEWEAGAITGDLVDGGAGVDTADYSASAAGVTVDLALAGRQALTVNGAANGDAAGDTLVGIENVIGSATGANTLYGDALNNFLGGGAAKDYLDGRGGLNVADYAGSTAGIVVDLRNTATVRTEAGWVNGDTWINIQGVRGSATASNILTGNSNANRLEGGAAADTIDAGDGDDIVNGRGGADTLIGGAGNDTLVLDGSRFDYTVTNGVDAQGAYVQFTDNRVEAPAGSARAYGFEVYQYKDVTTANAVANSAPSVLSLASGGAIAENSGAGTAVAQMQAADPDAGDRLTYSLVSNGGGRFAIDAATGKISVAPGAVLDFETTPQLDATTRGYGLDVRVTDLGGLSRTTSINIAVTDANDWPTGMTLTEGVIEEAAVGSATTTGTVVGTVSLTDPDQGETATFSLVNSAGGRFAIDSKTGVITVANPLGLNREIDGATHIVRVRGADSFGLSIDQEFTITLTNVSEAPLLSSNVNAFSVAPGTVGNVPNALLNMGTIFDVSSTTVITRLGAFDSGADGLVGPINVKIWDLSINQIVAQAIVPGGGGELINGFRYVDLATPVSLAAGFRGAIVADGFSAADLELQLSTGGAVTAASIAGVTFGSGRYGALPTIAWGGVLPFATASFTTGMAASVSVAENTTGVVYTAFARDPEGAAVKYSLLGADAARFTIGEANGEIRFAQAPDFESPQDSGADNTYDVIVKASDGAMFDERAFAIRVTNAAEAPVFAAGDLTAAINEGNAATTWSFAATDPESGAVTYALEGADKALFSVDASGVVRFNAAPDFDAPQDSGADNTYDFVVRATDPGGASSTREGHITINDVLTTVAGDSGANVFSPTAALASGENERFDGLSGYDAVDYSGASAPVGFAVGLASAVGTAGWGKGDQYANIEKLIGSQFNDVFEVARGASLAFDGGGGADTVRFAAGSGAVTHADASSALYANVEEIDARASGVTGAFTATSNWIQGLTGKSGAEAQLTLYLDAGDVVSVPDPSFTQGAYTFTDGNGVELAKLTVLRSG